MESHYKVSNPEWLTFSEWTWHVTEPLCCSVSLTGGSKPHLPFRIVVKRTWGTHWMPRARYLSMCSMYVSYYYPLIFQKCVLSLTFLKRTFYLRIRFWVIFVQQEHPSIWLAFIFKLYQILALSRNVYIFWVVKSRVIKKIQIELVNCVSKMPSQ